MRLVTAILALSMVAALASTVRAADPDDNETLAGIKSQLENLKEQVEHRPTAFQSHTTNGGSLMLFGAFCALWAQNTGRNPWLWFFLGMIFSVIAVIILLVKNAGDRRRHLAKPHPDMLDV